MIILYSFLIYGISVLIIIYYYCKVSMNVHFLAFVFLLTPIVNTLYALSLIIRGKFLPNKQSLHKQFKELIQ